MPEPPPIPRRNQVKELIGHTDHLNPGLLFDRFFYCWKTDKKTNIFQLHTPLTDILHNLCDDVNKLKDSLFYSKILEEIHHRQEKICQKKAGITLNFTTTGPLALGLGNSHPIENGFIFDRACGTPYLPGAAIKGICRAWARICQQKELANRLMGLEKDTKADAGDNESSMGELIFLDGYPTMWPELEVDVICNHHPLFYRTPCDKRRYNGNPANGPSAMDIESPLPVFHLALKENCQFSIRIVPNLEIAGAAQRHQSNLEQISGLLAEALAYLGIGARTAVGYGTMSIDTPDKIKDWENKEITSNEGADTPMSGIIRTFISYSHGDNISVMEHLAQVAPMGICPWVDAHEMQPHAGHCLHEQIEKGLNRDDIAAVTLFYSKNSMKSENVPKEVETAQKIEKRIVPFILDDDKEVENNLKKIIPLDEPYYINKSNSNRHKTWLKSILDAANMENANEIVLLMGHRSASTPSIESTEWQDKPVILLRSPLHGKEILNSAEIATWSPTSSDEYKKIQEAMEILNAALNENCRQLKRLLITGFTPLGIAGLIGKCWHRASGSLQLVTWNSYGKEEWSVPRENPGLWFPKETKYLNLGSSTNLEGNGSIDIGEGNAVALGHFSNEDQFQDALAWAKKNQARLKLKKIIHLTFPRTIRADNVAAVAKECAGSFAWARQEISPIADTLYWFSGLPMAIIPLVVYLSSPSKKIFIEYNKTSHNYVEAFEF